MGNAGKVWGESTENREARGVSGLIIVALGSHGCVVRLKGGFLARRSFAVAGHVTGFGSRLWLSTHSPETRTAPVLTRLVDNGAALLGKTIMAEFGYRCGAHAPASALRVETDEKEHSRRAMEPARSAQDTQRTRSPTPLPCPVRVCDPRMADPVEPHAGTA